MHTHSLSQAFFLFQHYHSFRSMESPTSSPFIFARSHTYTHIYPPHSKLFLPLHTHALSHSLSHTHSLTQGYTEVFFPCNLVPQNMLMAESSVCSDRMEVLSLYLSPALLLSLALSHRMVAPWHVSLQSAIYTHIGYTIGIQTVYMHILKHIEYIYLYIYIHMYKCIHICLLSFGL